MELVKKKNGKIAYSNTGKFKEEWEKGEVTDLIKLLQQTGKLKETPAQDVKKENELKKK